jgi:uncharacterized membrane protein YgaE (UPF0421/DUF939 family)
MNSDVSRTVRASGYRLLGTAIGVSIGVAVTITMLICALLGLAEASRLAGVAVAIVMLVSHPGGPWIAALHRFLEVSFGIVVAVVISALIWPS